MAVGTPTTNQAVSTTPTVTVPSGVASGDIVVLLLAQDATTGVFTGKWPAGFTQLLDANGTADGHSYGAAWKRLTGSDSGSYTMTADVGISAGWAMTAIPLTGRHATDPPVLSANSLQNTAQSSPITVTANGVTAVAGDDILFFSMPDVTATGVGNGHSSWAAGYTEIVDLEETADGWSNIGVAKAENVAAGATGSKTVTFSLTSNTAGWGAWLLRVPAAAGGGGTQALDGTSTGTSTTSGDLTVAHTLAATDAGTSTDTAALAVARPLAGTSGGSSASSGDLAVARPLAGASAGSSTDTGAVDVAHPLAGTSAGTSTSTGDLSLAGAAALAGTSAGTSTSTGALTVAHPLAGTSTGTSTSSGDLSIAGQVALAGTSTSTSTSTGALAVTRSLAGTSAGTSTDTGDLTVTASIVALAGTSAGLSTTTGSLAVSHTLAGVSGGASTSTGGLAVASANPNPGHWETSRPGHHAPTPAGHLAASGPGHFDH